MIKSLIIINAFITKVLTSHAHLPVGQYVHVTVPYPLPHIPNPPPPNYQTYQPYRQPVPQKATPISAPTAPNTAPAFEVDDTPIETLKPPVTKPEQKLPLTVKPLDSNVLNNLAIALQLLIVSNILSKPSQDTDREIAANLALSDIRDAEPILPARYSLPTASYVIETPPNYVLESSPYTLEPRSCYALKEPSSIPNAKYLGAPLSIVDSNVYSSHSPRSSRRSSAAIMSPYEVLTVSPDPILSSSYGQYTKRDFKSPYAMIAESKDFFTSDLF